MPRRKKTEAVPVPVKKDAVRADRFTRLRGMRDVLTDEYKYWNLTLKKADDLAAIYGFKRIETPVLEKLDLYERSTGKETDVVSKEMYSFVDLGGEKIALRPELTPSMVRAYIEHGMFNLPQPLKLYSIGQCFRHDKPQAGRYRQFNQFDVEVFGEAGAATDAQLILMAYNFFKELQINVQVQINSIGCPDCRPEYVKNINEFYKERGKRSKLCNDCKRRLVKNPLRLLDCKEEACQAIREDAPQIVDSLCDSCRDHFIKVLEYLDDLDIQYNLNPYLVRGLDYYNRTVFEFTLADEEAEEGGDSRDRQSRQASLGGGGRYDGLVEYMGGRPTPACGFGLGMERTINIIKEKNIPIKEEAKNYIFLAQIGEQAKRKAFVLFEDMRRAGFDIRQAITKDSLKSQLEDANRLGAKYTLILGQKEIIDGTIIIRDMESGAQEVVDMKKVQAEMTKRFEEKTERKISFSSVRPGDSSLVS